MTIPIIAAALALWRWRRTGTGGYLALLVGVVIAATLVVSVSVGER